MKTLKSKLFIFSIITLVLTGCMPDSMTKYKKDPPKKVVTPEVVLPPVVDESGTQIKFDEPTFYSFTTNTTNIGEPVHIPIATTAAMKISIDGSLGDPEKAEKFFERCDLMTTGVNAQAASLPAGLSLDTSTCVISGTPTTPKSIVTAFCSNGTSTDQATCEADPLVWNSTTSTCSIPDLAYSTQAECEDGFNTWYAATSAVPYRIRLKYHDADGVQKSIFSTLLLGVYKPLTALSYTQSEKVLLKITETTSTPPFSESVAPLLTTTATVGAYAKNNILVSSANVYGVAKFVNTNYIGVNKLVPIKVTSTTPFTVDTFVTKSGNSSFVGKIFKIDSANRILYVENISSSNNYFVAGDRLCANNTTGVCGTSYLISSIEENYTYKPENKLDNDKQYYQEKFKVVIPINVFEVASPIKALRPISTSEISSTNGLTYTISPALPCNDPAVTTDCLSLDSSTGVISGTFGGVLDNTEFKITASNPLGEVSTSVYLNAIVAPTKLAYTNKQIITVASNALFNEGETVIQPITPPLVEAVTGRIIKKIGSYRMAIETFNGTFSEDASLDNNNSAYQAEKTYILPFSTCSHTNYTTQATCEAANYAWAPTEDIHYNIAIVTNNTGNYVAGDNVTSTAGTGSGATGRVMFVETVDDVIDYDILYVQYLTGSATATSSAKTFYEDDTLNIAGTSVVQVQNGTMKVTLTSAASFDKGSDIVTNKGTAAYTNAVNGNVLSLSEISKTTNHMFSNGTTVPLVAADTIYNDEKQSGATSTTITAVTHDNFFIFERGKKMVLNAATASGTGLIYSISPALPSGLTLDSLTGIISGAATNASVKKDYLITATNFTGSTTNVVAFEVKDFFEITEKTGASSAIMHKVGDYQVNRKCRVDATDIANLSNGKALDIRCFLDMEEEELHETDLTFLSSSGAGICQFIQVEPYNFQAWKPLQTAATTVYTTSGCATSADVPVPANWVGYAPDADNTCVGNYTSVDGPNCDEGSFTVVNYDGSDVDGDGTACEAGEIIADTAETIDCGGKKINCLAGPVTDLLTPEQLEIGNRSLIYATANGTKVTNTFKSPFSKLLKTNLSVANSSINNQCTMTNADTDTWADLARTTAAAVAPYGETQPFYSFYCLDGAKDIKARIRLAVRDWNKTFKINSEIYKDHPGGAGGTALMNNSAISYGKSNNDYYDWDDAYNGAAAAFAGACGVKGAGTDYLFPQDKL